MTDIKRLAKNLDHYICGGCNQLCFSYYICELCNEGICVGCKRNVKNKPENYCKNCYYNKLA